DGAGMQWKDRSIPVNGPIQRTSPAIAYDNKRGKLMLFGGYKSGDTNPYKQDIWQWAGMDATWTSRTGLETKPPPPHPSARAADTVRDKLWLYSGSGNGTLDDLWSWNRVDQTWTRVTPAGGTRPPAMAGHFMWYDRARDKLLVLNTNYQFW